MGGEPKHVFFFKATVYGAKLLAKLGRWNHGASEILTLSRDERQSEQSSSCLSAGDSRIIGSTHLSLSFTSRRHTW